MPHDQEEPPAWEIDSDPPDLSTSTTSENAESVLPSQEPLLARAGIERMSETSISGQKIVASAINSGGAVPLGELGEVPPAVSEEEREEEGRGVGSLLRETVETVVLAVLIFLVIRSLVQNYRIEGQSMEPNLHHGQYLLVNKLAYRLGEFRRGDVIVFHYPNNPAQDYIKRIIGLPGDTVEIRNGELFVNGLTVDEPYDSIPIMRNIPAVTVDPGFLYVLGDNRPTSSDTRTWGQLSQEFVIGKAWLAIWPLEESGLVKHTTFRVEAKMDGGP